MPLQVRGTVFIRRRSHDHSSGLSKHDVFKGAHQFDEQLLLDNVAVIGDDPRHARPNKRQGHEHRRVWHVDVDEIDGRLQTPQQAR